MPWAPAVFEPEKSSDPMPEVEPSHAIVTAKCSHVVVTAKSSLSTVAGVAFFAVMRALWAVTPFTNPDTYTVPAAPSTRGPSE